MIRGMLSVLKGYCVSLFLPAKKGYRSPEKNLFVLSGFFTFTHEKPGQGAKGLFR